MAFSQKGVAGVTLPAKVFDASPVEAKEAAAAAAHAKLCQLYS